MAKRPPPTRLEPEATEGDEESPFLSRWARRKRLSRSGADPDARAAESADTAAEEAAPAEVGDEAAEEPRELTDADMPALESIDESTDMSGFFSPKVSERVKRMALRKFFHSSAFNVVDGLDDYADDFTAFEALGDIITSDMRGIAEQKAKQAEEALAAEQEAAKEGSVAEAPAGESDGAANASAEPEQTAEGGEETESASAEHSQDDSESGVARAPVASGAPKLRPRGEAGEES